MRECPKMLTNIRYSPILSNSPRIGVCEVPPLYRVFTNILGNICLFCKFGSAENVFDAYQECTNTLIRKLLVRLFSPNVLGYSPRINVWVVSPLHWRLVLYFDQVISIKNRFSIMIDWSVFKIRFFNPIIYGRSFYFPMIDLSVSFFFFFFFFYRFSPYMYNCAIQTLRFIRTCVGLWGP